MISISHSPPRSGFDWKRVNFLCRDLYNVVFWIFYENGGNALMFSLLQDSVYTEPRPSLLLVLPCQRGGRGCTRSWEQTQPGQQTQTGQRDLSHNMVSCSAIKVGVKKEEGEDVPSRHVMSPAFLEVTENMPADGK